MRKTIPLMAALLLITGPALGAAPGSTLDTVRRAGVLIAGVAEEEPPFSFREPGTGRLAGYDVDFLEAVGKELGVDVRFKAVNAENRLSELLDGGIDVLAGGLTQSSTRAAVIDFTVPYVTSGQKLIAPKGEVSTLEDLTGKKVGTVVGTFAETCARDRCTVSRIVPFDSYVDGIRALEEGKVDVFTADEAILVDLFAGLPSAEYEIPDLMLVRQEYRLGVRHGDDDLRSVLDRSIRNLQQTGQADRIRARWFTPQKELPPPAYGSVVRKAAVRPRFLGVVLNGLLHPETDVTIFSLNGERVGRGRITGVYGDEFYLDVEEGIYDFIRPGFLVAMNMNADMAMDVLMRRQEVLKDVRAQAEQQAQEVREQINEEAEAKRQRAIEMDIYRERLEEAAQSDRARYFRYYRRRHHW